MSLILLPQCVARGITTPTQIASEILFLDEFNSSIDDKWIILNEDKSYYNLDKDHLYLRASNGDLWQSRTDYKNLFLIDNPTTGDFEITIRIIQFLPSSEGFPQLDIVAYDDDDNHVRSIYGLINTNKLEFGNEVDQVWTSSQQEKDFSSSLFFLRLRKIGKTYFQYYSTDGIEFVQANSPVIYGDGNPDKLGFVAMVDPAETSTAIIDRFEIASLGDGHLFSPGKDLTEESTYTNPVYIKDFPDPFIFSENGNYYAYATNADDQNIPLLRSSNVISWEEIGDALPQLPEWAASNEFLTWAPSLLKRGENYILFYTARYSVEGVQCISHAISDSLEGPFIDDSSSPFICQTDLGGSIDPSPFVDIDGKAYLLWKNDGNAVNKPAGLWVQELSFDGIGLIGKPTQLIQKDQIWEEPTIEGPSMIENNGKYYLFYSANWWSSEYYAIGYAICEQVQGSCVKISQEPFFASKGNVLGPGGQEFFKDIQGNLWMVYHAWTAPNVGYENNGMRSLRIEPVTFIDGNPTINGPTETMQPFP